MICAVSSESQVHCFKYYESDWVPLMPQAIGWKVQRFPVHLCHIRALKEKSPQSYCECKHACQRRLGARFEAGGFQAPQRKTAEHGCKLGLGIPLTHPQLTLTERYRKLRFPYLLFVLSRLSNLLSADT